MEGLTVENRVMKHQIDEFKVDRDCALTFLNAIKNAGPLNVNQIDALKYAFHYMSGEPIELCAVLIDIKPNLARHNQR